MHVVAAQLIGNGPRGRGRPRNDALHAQDLEYRDERRMYLSGRAQRPARAVAARQGRAKELLDAAFVEHACRQGARRHPVREMRYGAQAAPARLGGIPATLQSADIGRDLGGQRAFEQPAAQDRVQFRDYGHDGLQWWSRRYCARNRFMSSAAGWFPRIATAGAARRPMPPENLS